MGIHNEAGFQRVSPVPSLSELVQTLLDLLLSQSDPERGFLSIQRSGKDKVVLLVNNLGGVSELELAGVAREATAALSARDIKVSRVISGTLMVARRSSSRTALALTLMWRGADEFEHARFFPYATSSPSNDLNNCPHSCCSAAGGSYSFPPRREP
jgi:triose/dihydroxyacetone kinase / FAD-AMP lyase (cyclizing)